MNKYSDILEMAYSNLLNFQTCLTGLQNKLEFYHAFILLVVKT